MVPTIPLLLSSSGSALAGAAAAAAAQAPVFARPRLAPPLEESGSRTPSPRCPSPARAVANLFSRELESQREHLRLVHFSSKGLALNVFLLWYHHTFLLFHCIYPEYSSLLSQIENFKYHTMLLTGLDLKISLLWFGGGVTFPLFPYRGLQDGGVTLDEKAEILFTGQFTVTTVVLGVIYSITNTFQPFPDVVFCYGSIVWTISDMKDAFNLQDGWLLRAGIGLVGAVTALALAGSALVIFNDEPPQRSPTPVSVLISAAIFALAHLTSGEFPQLFVLGCVLGFSYAQTRNLLTPITIQALWNSGVIILLTILLLQGYDIRELLQSS